MLNTEKLLDSLLLVLKKENIVPAEYDIILVLLSAYNDGIEIYENISKNRQNSINNLTETITKRKEINYRKIINIYYNIISKISINGRKEIRSVLNGVNRNTLNKVFYKIFDHILYRLSSIQGPVEWEGISPIELSRLISVLAELPPNSRIYNPFAGLASLCVNMDSGFEYYGQEINQRTWALGTLRIMAYGRLFESKLENINTFEKWPDVRNKFDLIVSIPPYSKTFRNDFKDSVYDGEKFNNIFEYLIVKGIKLLSENGKLILVIPEHIIKRGISKKIIHTIVSIDLLEKIIYLPGGILQNIGIPSSVLVLNKSKLYPNKITLIDATKYIHKRNVKERIIDEYQFNLLLIDKIIDKDSLKIVNREEILLSSRPLHVPQFFEDPIEGLLLEEILSLQQNDKNQFPIDGRIVRSVDLSRDKSNYILDYSIIPARRLVGKELILVNRSCLLVSQRIDSLNPTYFEYIDIPIYISNDVHAFAFDESKVDIEYLIHELYSDYIQKQIRRIQTRNESLIYDVKDFEKIVIKLPSLLEQRAKVNAIYEFLDDYKNLKEERNKLAHGILIKESDEQASLKHTLGRPRQNILDWAHNMIEFFNSRNDYSLLNQSFKNTYLIDIIGALNEIKRDIGFITEVLEKGEGGLRLKNYELQPISLFEICNSVRNLKEAGYKYTINKKIQIFDNPKNLIINSNIILLSILLQNILTNADKHGFQIKEIRNEVVIALSLIDGIFIIEIKNNGKHFPRNYNRKKFITKYSTSAALHGSGIGGYDINRIAAYFGDPNWELILNNDPIYPVMFRFRFPLITIK